MGVVYRATDKGLHRAVALKILPAEFASDEERKRRFLREARSAAAVTHPNIATVHEVGEADGHLFIAMELIEGQTLRDQMAPGLTHAEALRIAREVAKGLARAHEKGVVHRDLKPENVMVTEEGGVKILDFGLAKLRIPEEPVGPTQAEGPTASQLTAEGRVMGTPPYMSPEQVQGRSDIDARSDVFSFGAMLYELLVGERPFRGSTSVEVLYGVLHREPTPVEQLQPTVPAFAAAVEARRGYLDQCARMTPQYVGCQTARWHELAGGVDCAALESFARELVALRPGRVSAGLLVEALAADDAPHEAIEAALQGYHAAATSVPSPSFLRAYVDDLQSVEYLEGDFVALEESLRADSRSVAIDFAERARWTDDLASVLEDTGRAAEAVAVVRRIIQERRGLATVTRPDYSLLSFYRRALNLGVVTLTEIEKWTSPDPTWKNYEAVAFARTTDEARAALKGLPPASELSSLNAGNRYQVARVRMLAGDFAGAEQEESTALHRCDVLSEVNERPRAYLLLGEAAEKTGQLDVARDAYKTLIARWGALKPKAVVADLARARLAKLPSP